MGVLFLLPFQRVLNLLADCFRYLIGAAAVNIIACAYGDGRSLQLHGAEEEVVVILSQTCHCVANQLVANVALEDLSFHAKHILT